MQTYTVLHSICLPAQKKSGESELKARYIIIRRTWYSIVVVQLLARILLTAEVFGQTESDSLKHILLEEVGVFGIQNIQSLRDSPLQVEIIAEEELNQGDLDLASLLGRHGNLRINQSFGSGLQWQGLPSSYIKVLRDGEPIIGRQSGTLDLTRLDIQNLKQIEIVKGPSSSDFGSDALAGVVNLVSSSGEHRAVDAKMTFSTPRGHHLGLSSATKLGDQSVAKASIGHGFSSGLWDSEMQSKLIPRNRRLHGMVGLESELRPDLKTKITLRRSSTELLDSIGQSGGPIISAPGSTSDWSLASDTKFNSNNFGQIRARVYRTEFLSSTSFGELPSEFEQSLQKYEINWDPSSFESRRLLMGIGYQKESVRSVRIASGVQQLDHLYSFIQDHWSLPENFESTSALRTDYFSDYGLQLSPRLGLLYKYGEKYRARFSAGRAFKSPSFQQRYMDFTNPGAGYTVLGSIGLTEQLARLESEQIIDGTLDSYQARCPLSCGIEPEIANSFNLGIDRLDESFSFRLNLFLNLVENLIETQAVARKNNGPLVFSYFNEDRIRTRGLESSFGWAISKSFDLDLSYQYLSTYDADVIEDLEAGKVFGRVNGQDRRLSRNDYRGLFGRSAHSISGRISLAHNPRIKTRLHARYQSSYGDYDRNGNGIYDSDSEAVKGYAIIDLTSIWQKSDRLSLNIGIENIFNHQNLSRNPGLAVRTLRFGLRLIYP